MDPKGRRVMEMDIEPVAELGLVAVKVTSPFGYVELMLDNSNENYNMADVIGALIRPALLAQGYDPSVVAKYVPEVYF